MRHPITNIKYSDGRYLKDIIVKIVSEKAKDATLTWEDVARFVKEECGFDKSESWYRKGGYHNILDEECDKEEPIVDEVEKEKQSIDDKIFELKKQKYKLSEERIQTNAYIRRLSREDTIIEIASEAARTISKSKPLINSNKISISTRDGYKAGLLQLSDWHYGIDIDSAFNNYDPFVAQRRVSNLCDEVMRNIAKENLSELHVFDLGDLICGRIHLTLRLQSRIDTITQVLEVSEILCEFLNRLSTTGIKVYFYSCLDNHSRVEPNKSDSLDLESLARIIPWYMKNRLNNVEVVDNKFGPDIISTKVLGHNIIAVHGHDDAPINNLDRLTMLTKQHWDILLTAHNHHFYADERNETIILGNGTLMGTDQYAEKKRLSSKPSQNLIIVTEDNVISDIKRILV